jgi:hypothetical protein
MVKRFFLFIIISVFILLNVLTVKAETYTGEPSNRVKINLGETPWKFIRSNPANAKDPAFNDATYPDVGIPYTWNDVESFLNMPSGGGDGEMAGGPFWYRKHFTIDPKYAGRKVYLEFEGAHVGIQVYVNGTFMPGNSAVNPQATHVIGFIGFVLDITNYVKFDGSDNVIACCVSKSQGFYSDPGFSLVFRFGQGDAGIFRPVWLHITDKVHVPLNVYSCVNRWGTYVAAQTVADNGSSATIKVQTNVYNDGTSPQNVTLVTKMVDKSNNNVVWSSEASQTIAAQSNYVFDQTATVTNPKLWYPNNSPYGKPNMHRVYHIVKVGGTTVDVFETDFGIRVITWDKDFPYINGKKHLLYGASARYDYPALGTALPPEVEWRDAKLLADIGGSLWRPGHSSCSRTFVEACDAYGVMLIQPSGEGEGAFSGTSATDNRGKLKTEIQRDVIIRDRNSPSILAWEISNGPIATAFAQSLKALAQQWDPVHTRAIADRTPNSANGDILSCTVVGCEIGVKNQFPNNPAWGAEWWSDYGRLSRWGYDYEIAFCADYLNAWVKTRKANCFGMAQWYMAETPGEDGIFLEVKNQTNPPKARSFGCSMMDFNRIPKFLYYAYKACWIPFSSQPVVAISHHWNRSGNVRVNVFSNCPKVRLLINGVSQGEKTPNSIDGVSPNNDHTQNSTQLPLQCYWDVTWQAGTLRAEGLDANGNVVCFDEKKTAGEPKKIILTLDPPVVKPNGEIFQLRANGSDAALILATVVDANGNWCPTASGLINWSVSGPGVYKGGSDQFVDATKPKTWHAPGDPELSIEGGKCKVAVRTTFTPGTVNVTATSSGLESGQISFNVLPVTAPVTTIVKQAQLTQNLQENFLQLISNGNKIHYYLSEPSFISYDIVEANGRIIMSKQNFYSDKGWHQLIISGNNIRKTGVCFIRFKMSEKREIVKRLLISH